MLVCVSPWCLPSFKPTLSSGSLNWSVKTVRNRFDGVRGHVRLNEPHRTPLTPSWYGDSVGHYEGDTLVIDTIGQKTDRKYAMIDLFGTPYNS
jgi:hypothetical protein